MNGALYEIFTGAADPLDLASSSIYYNTVRFVPTSSTATAYRLDVDLN